MNDKKQQLIITAMDLFYRNGIHAVGINEILKQSGIAKKTLYHHFANKDDLVLATLTLRDQRFMAWMQSHLSSQTDPKQAVVQLFYGLDDWFNSRAEALGSFKGCFFINVSAEFSDTEHPINQACKSHKLNVFEAIKARTEQFESDSTKATELAEVLCILKEGSITRARVENRLDAAIKALPAVKTLVGL